MTLEHNYWPVYRPELDLSLLSAVNIVFVRSTDAKANQPQV